MWKKIASFLGKLTDVLIKGRQAGLWSQKQGGSTLDQPHKPEDIGGIKG